MMGKFIFLMGVLLITCGFTSGSDEMRAQLNVLPQHYTNFDVKMAWDTQAVNGNTVIEGVIQNVRYATMEDIEIWVSLLDNKGKMVQRAVDYVAPRQLDMDAATAFSVKLPTVAPHGAKLVFTYKYGGLDGGGDGPLGGGTYWMQSFESYVP